MSVSRFLLFPAVLSVPLFAPTLAKAQEKTAANPGVTQPTPRAELTPPARPATNIAPRQNLPVFTAVKATLSPVLAAPTTANSPQTVAAPAKAAMAPKAAAASLSAREISALTTSAPVAATPPVVRGRRAFGSAVSMATSPGKAMDLTPPTSVVAAPVVAAPIAPAVAVKAVQPLPTIEVAPVAKPSVLASREARAREIALARLDAQLAGAEGRLDRAQSKLTEGQRQLGNVNQLLQSAMLNSGGSGLHPFVRVAQRYLGTPYVWGGESARGFDCSGFIMRVMRDLGYKALPHSAAEQFNYGKPIAKNLLQPGDIVFFANTYKPGISHVGIYLGGGRFIHAANSQVGTIVSNLNSPKWVEHYAGARRLMKMS